MRGYPQFKGSEMMNLWLAILLIIIALIGGAILGFFGARKYMENYLQENPPIDENMIRVMMGQMGQKPSEKKVKQMTHMMKNQSKKAAKNK